MKYIKIILIAILIVILIVYISSTKLPSQSNLNESVVKNSVESDNSIKNVTEPMIYRKHIIYKNNKNKNRKQKRK